MVSGAARGLLVSPWFAAGAGFVIAATAFIVAPRAEFAHNNAIKVTPCTERECTQPIPQGVPTLSVPSEEIVGSAAVPLGVAVGYRVLPQQRDTFQLEITLAGSQAGRDWSLSFVIPGATIISVEYAQWQPSGTGGGTARGLVSGSGSTAAGFGGGDQGSSQYGRRQSAITFFVTGRGSPADLTGCVYDGQQCHFSPSS